jgi:hypothetical protein
MIAGDFLNSFINTVQQFERRFSYNNHRLSYLGRFGEAELCIVK